MAKIGKLSVEVEGEPTQKHTLGSESLTAEKIVELATVDGEMRVSLAIAKTWLVKGGQYQGVQLVIEEENPEA